VVFAATSESDEYLRDYRGIRRYWPLRCGEINLTALAAARDQLFAEAFRAYLDGAHWHDVPVLEAQAEQAERQEQDVWLTDIASWAAARDEVTVSDVATYCLNIETARKTQSEANRIAKCLKAIGFIPVVTRVQGASVRVYRRRK
jgi:predicted P-loop ATPase